MRLLHASAAASNAFSQGDSIKATDGSSGYSIPSRNTAEAARRRQKNSGITYLVYYTDRLCKK